MKPFQKPIKSCAFRVLTLVLLSLCGHAFAQQPHTLTGDIRAHKSFHSNILKNDREVIVYLPPGYGISKSRRYSVLYVHDGQNLFDGATSFIPGQEWRIDETAERLINGGKMEPLIVVGVYNTKDRIDEYTPAPDPKYKMGGKADLYGRMLVEELKPFIDSQYRTKHDAKHTGLMGSSLGGLASLYLALKYPQVFGRAGVVSPSVWFAGRHIVHYVESQPKNQALEFGWTLGQKKDELRKKPNNRLPMPGF